MKTNYNERLDKLLRKYVNEAVRYEKTGLEHHRLIEAKSALTQLFKDLVDEAEPEIVNTAEYPDAWSRGVEGYKRGLLKLLEGK